MDNIEATNILKEAKKAGDDALNACTPLPMIVQEHANMLDDHSEVIRSYHVPDGVCGFAWINIKLTNTTSKQFINALKRLGFAEPNINAHNDAPIKKSFYYGGYMYWVREGNQSMQKKEAFAHAFAKVLTDNDIICHVGSRMD